MQLDIDKFANEVRRRINKHVDAFYANSDDLEDRLQVLISAIRELDRQYGLGMKISLMLIDTQRDYIRTLAYLKKWRQEYDERHRRALNGIEALNSLACGFKYGELFTILFQWTADELISIAKLKKKIEEKYDEFQGLFEVMTWRLKPYRTRKYSRRSYFRKYYLEINNLLKANDIRAGRRAEFIADLFYGIGLEKEHGDIAEIKRLLGKGGDSRLR